MYVPIKVNLSDAQVKKLAKAASVGGTTTLRMAYTDLITGGVTVYVTPTQARKVEKAKKASTGVQLHFSAAQLKHHTGSGFFSSIARAVAPVVVDAGVDAISGAAKSGLKGLVGGRVKPTKKRQVAAGFFGDVFKSVAPVLIDTGVDALSGVAKSGLKSLVKGGKVNRRRGTSSASQPKRSKAGSGIYAPGGRF